MLLSFQGKGETNNISEVQKHPLTTSWTFWYLDPEKSKSDWKNALKEIYKFDTVEDFWAHVLLSPHHSLVALTVPLRCRLYHNIMPVSKLRTGSNYCLFRGGLSDMRAIRPEWEDKENRAGGCWKTQFSMQIGPVMDDVFREIVG